MKKFTINLVESAKVKETSNGLKNPNPTEKILSAGFFYPLEKPFAYIESFLKRL
jgi:hypothetical protein